MPTAWKTGFPWNAGTREVLIKITSLEMAEKAGLSERRDLLFQEKIPKNLKSQFSNFKSIFYILLCSPFPSPAFHP